MLNLYQEKNMANNNVIDISFIVPSIRVDMWKLFYEHIQNSFSGNWEVIFIGPYDNPESLQFASNVKCIANWGTPTKCRQIAILVSQGKWICHTSDDALFVTNELDKAFLQTKHTNDVILGKYLEGDPNGLEMRQNEYFTFGYHDVFKHSTQWIPKNYWLIQTGFISNKLLREIGGLDCQFETCAMAYCDLSARLQNHNAKIVIHEEPISILSHSPGPDGDHAPIHNAMLYHDIPLFNQIYGDSECLKRTKIDINNWKNSPDVWVRRFGQ